MKSFLNKKQTDPVCGLQIDPGLSDFTTVHNRHAYYFCSRVCLDRFKKDGDRYVRISPRGLKGFWSRYIDRVQKATDGKPPCCH